MTKIASSGPITAGKDMHTNERRTCIRFDMIGNDDDVEKRCNIEIISQSTWTQTMMTMFSLFYFFERIT